MIKFLAFEDNDYNNINTCNYKTKYEKYKIVKSELSKMMSPR